jgi:hypothetical protein
MGCNRGLKTSVKNRLGYKFRNLGKSLMLPLIISIVSI